jgi:hypothetical protein
VRASFFDEEEDIRSSDDVLALRHRVTTAYQNAPFRGPPFVLPGGRVLVEDMWAASLDTALDDALDAGRDGLEAFSLELWLGAKVRAEGTDEQKRQYEELLASLDAPPEPVDEGFRAGLPADIYSDVVHQPLQEVDVYRGLDDLVLPEETNDEAADGKDDSDDEK